MKAISLVLGCVALLAMPILTGCSNGDPSNDASDTAADEAALTQGSSAALKKTIDTSVAFFSGGDGKRTREIEIDRAPEPVAAKLQSAYAAMVAELSDWGNESELEKGVYQIFKTSKKKNVIGYAIWVYGDNGDAGRGLVRGFDLNGKQIYEAEDSWAED